jgi:tetratricopeptide (TPR) repeat protein
MRDTSTKFWTPLTLIASLFLLFTLGDARADGDLRDRIARLDRSIAATTKPNDSTTAALHLSRAELRRLVNDWPGSLSDLELASRLNSNLADLELQWGMTLLGVGRSHEAVVAFRKHLSSKPDDAFAWTRLGRALTQLQLHDDASDAFAKAISLSNTPGPGLFLERADALQAQGASRYSEALGSIESGIATIGPAIALELRALELEKTLGRFDRALLRVSSLADRSRSKAPWLLRKGKILLLAGRPQEARHTFEKAKALALNARPARRNTPSNTDLIRSIEYQLAATAE